MNLLGLPSCWSNPRRDSKGWGYLAHERTRTPSSLGPKRAGARVRVLMTKSYLDTPLADRALAEDDGVLAPDLLDQQALGEDLG